MLAYLDPGFEHKELLWFVGLFILICGGIWLCRKYWLTASITGFIILLLGMAIIPSTIPARGYAEQSACINNLRQIENAKTRWATEHNKQKTDMPMDSDLFGEGSYLKSKPKCPSGGSYILGSMNETPRCTLGEAKGHKLDGVN